MEKLGTKHGTHNRYKKRGTNMAAWNAEEYYEGERNKVSRFLDTVDAETLSDLGRIEYVKAAALLEIARKLK